MNNEEKILRMLEEMKADMTEMKADMAGMSALLQKVAVTQEGVVLPQLKLLAEGH